MDVVVSRKQQPPVDTMVPWYRTIVWTVRCHPVDVSGDLAVQILTVTGEGFDHDEG